jgi:hypothetical protein
MFHRDIPEFPVANNYASANLHQFPAALMRMKNQRHPSGAKKPPGAKIRRAVYGASA